jgi:alpha-L-rhamnosidase
MNHLLTASAAVIATLCAMPIGNARDQVTDLRVEYLPNPIGIDVPRPRFFWVMASSRRGARQMAYRILVSTRRSELDRNAADAWDSGKIPSSENAQIEYGGSKLQARTRYFFKIMLWDEADRLAVSSASYFETAFLDASEWRARFIGLQANRDSERQPFVGARWIGPAKPRETSQRLGFRTSFQIEDTRKLAQADLFVVGAGDLKNWVPRNRTQLWLNDKALPGFSADHNDPRRIDLTPVTMSGMNHLVVLSPAYVGQPFIATIHLRFVDGSIRTIRSDHNWFVEAFDTQDTAKSWAKQPTRDLKLSSPAELGLFGSEVNQKSNAIDHIVPPIYLRKVFNVKKSIRQARLYATAAGVYELRLNGGRVGDQVLAPGWTDYRKRIRYQTYDVTKMIRPGANTIGGIVGDGWYSGRTGIGRHLWGFEKALAAELHVVFSDGTEEVVATDASWEGNTGPISRSDMIDGETYDARRELSGWDTAKYSSRDWRPVNLPVVEIGKLEAQPEPPLRITRTLKSVSTVSRPSGESIVDLGQNIVGWVRLRMIVPAGTRVVLRYGELLNADGSLFVGNLRNAIATDEYIAKGVLGETFEPHFTVHGFRYVEVRGIGVGHRSGVVEGIVVHNDLRETGTFKTSNPLINQLQSNIVWSQRGNFFSVPTDCPQRDERLGWTGDIQLFGRTGSFNMDTATFLSKYLVDLEDTQTADGSIANIAPTIPEIGGGAYGWGDAMVILPELIFRLYGDRRVIERHFSAMKKWVDYRTTRARNFLNSDGSFGDWLAPERTPDKILSPIFHFHSALLLSQMATAIGRTADANEYKALANKIRDAWNIAFVDEDGRIESDTQTAYVLALRYRMLPERIRDRSVLHLERAIARADHHLATGFLGTGHLLPALAESGRVALAYELLMTETYPSWLYPVRNGATTIWERWDGFSPQTGPTNKGGMNSYNHYAFGAVGEWMYSHILGIDMDHSENAATGFSRVVIRPTPGGGISRATGSYYSVRGTIATSWNATPGSFRLDVDVPVHATAVINIPIQGGETTITESGRPVQSASGVASLGPADGFARFAVGSGHYRFETRAD